MLYSGQKAFENFFKRHKFRRTRRFRSSFRASFIGRPHSAQRSTPTNQDSVNNESPKKWKKTKQIEIIKLDDSDGGTIISKGGADLSEHIDTSSPLNAKKVVSNSPVLKEKFTKSRPKTADTHNNKNNNNNNSTKNHLNSTTILSEGLEKESQTGSNMVDLLKTEVTGLRKEITKQRETIFILQEREKQLQFRLSEQARKQIEKGSTKFEDLSLGNKRPTQLIKRFGNLYSEVRVEALDALEDMPEVRECDDLKIKLLLSILVLSFRSAQKTLLEIKGKIREILQFPKNTDSKFSAISSAAKDLEEEEGVYLRKSIDKFNLKKNSVEVGEKIWTTLYDYPILRNNTALSKYIDECVSVAWALSVQNPPLLIDYETGTYDATKHTRFHTSDPDSDLIRSCLWPALIEGEKGMSVCKGIVVT